MGTEGIDAGVLIAIITGVLALAGTIITGSYSIRSGAIGMYSSLAKELKEQKQDSDRKYKLLAEDIKRLKRRLGRAYRILVDVFEGAMKLIAQLKRAGIEPEWIPTSEITKEVSNLSSFVLNVDEFPDFIEEDEEHD